MDAKAGGKGKYGNGRGTERLYAIEARTTYPEPQMVNGMILTREWRRVPIRHVDGGALIEADPRQIAATPHVPAGYRFPAAKLAEGLAARDQAVLLAQRFHMQPDGRIGLCIQTRLVEVEVTYSYDTKEIGVTEPYSMFEATRWLQTSPREDASPAGSAEAPSSGD